jgi:hypothetical protein
LYLLIPISLGQGRDLEKKFEPSLLNTAIYLLGLSQQVSTFVLNFQVCLICGKWRYTEWNRADLSEKAFERTLLSSGVLRVSVLWLTPELPISSLN